MENVKWLLRKYGFVIVPMIIVVIISGIVSGKRGSARSAEEVWEPPVIVGGKDFEAEEAGMVESAAEEISLKGLSDH